MKTLSHFRIGQVYRHQMANGSRRKFRVIRLCPGSAFGPEATMLIEYVDDRSRQYVNPKLKPLV